VTRGPSRPGCPTVTGSAAGARNALHLLVREIRLVPSELRPACLERCIGHPGSQGGGHFNTASTAVSSHCIFLLFSSTAKAEQDRYFLAALTSSDGYDHRAGNATLALGIDQEELEQLLWFFRREDRKCHCRCGAESWNRAAQSLAVNPPA